MAQLAAGNNGSHVIDIDVDDRAERTEPHLDQLAAEANHCHVNDVTDARPEPPECAVCMERLWWVAVGPCGHLEVCLKCAVRIRSGVDGNRQCCICRTPCPAVVVTRRSGAGDEKDVYTKVSALAADEGRVGSYWYHKASAAYFDDERTYNAAKKACSELERAEVVGDGGDENDDDVDALSVVIFIVFVVIILVGFVMMCIGYAADERHWSHHLAVSLGRGFAFAAVASTLVIFLDWLCEQRGRQH